MHQVIKARGKESIISLIQYFDALGIDCFVIHDEDTEAGAVKFNAPILAALKNNESRRLMVKHTVVDLIHYPEPSYEKPYEMYQHISENWGTDWVSVSKTWRDAFETLISPELFPKG